MSSIVLTGDQIQAISSLTLSAPDRLARRARLLLAYADGKPTMQAASEAGISRGRARYWKRQFLASGMAIFNVQVAGSGSKLVETQQDSPSFVTIPDTLPPQELQGFEKNITYQVPYPVPKASIGITPLDTLAEAGRKIWLYHFAVMLSHETGTLLGEDIEELHDMRVATRRMRTAFDVFGSGYQPKIMKKYRKGLRQLGGMLGTVRDMDVLLVHALRYQQGLAEEEQPGLEPLLSAWRQTIQKGREKLAKHLQSEQYLEFKREFNLFLQVPEDNSAAILQTDGTAAHVRDIVPVLVYSRYAAVRAYADVIPTASLPQLHALRIEYKKFRYTLEYFKEILGGGVNQLINEIKQLQDHLGELHDADVACQLVRSFLKNLEEAQGAQPIPVRANPEPIVRYLACLHSERYNLLISFPELWEKFSRAEYRQNLARAISSIS